MKIKISFILFFLIIILLYIFINYSLQNKNIYTAYEKLEDKYSFLPSFVTIDRAFNEVNISKATIRRGNVDDDDSINIFLSYNDLTSFRDYYYDSINSEPFFRDEGNEWRKAKVSFSNSNKMKAKIKLHGTSQAPLIDSKGFINSWIFNAKKSLMEVNDYPKSYIDITKGGYAFKIKLSDDKVFEGKSRINLLSPHDDWTVTANALNKYISSLNIITTYGNFYNLFVNGSDVGLYLGIENISKNLLERNFKITNYGILKNYDDWDKAWGVSHTSPTMYTGYDMELSGEPLTQKIALFQLKRLFDALDENNFENIKALTDIEYLARLYATTILVGDFHPLTGDNTRYIYDFSTGTFKVAFRLEGSPKRVSYIEKDKNLELSFEKYGPHILFSKLSTQNWFIDLALKNLMKLDADSSHILNMIYQEHEIYKTVSSKSRFPSNHHSYKYFDEVEIINSNLKLIKKIINEGLTFEIDNNLETNNYDIKLNYAKIFFNIEKDEADNFNLNILNDSLSNISISSISNCDGEELNFESPIILKPARYNQNTGIILDEKNNKFTIPSSFSCINNAKAINKTTNKPILDKDIYFNYSESFELIEKSGLSQFGSNLKKSTKHENSLIEYTILSGTYEINENVIFPQDAKLIIKPGVKILIAESKSILVRGDFSALGTPSNPIVIKNKDEKPYGTFAVKGTTLNPSQAILENVSLQGGSEAIIDGTYFSGQLSIHITNVIIKNSEFQNSFSDDGINIKLGDVEITNNIFRNNSADQVDLDFVKGNVSNNIFIYTIDNKDVSTDGLDVSGSILNINENSFINMTDKGLSVGEKSFVNVYNNEVKNNNIGIALKDGSSACLDQNSFFENIDDIAQYIKKNMYKMPNLFINRQQLGDGIEFSGTCVLDEFLSNQVHKSL